MDPLADKQRDGRGGKPRTPLFVRLAPIAALLLVIAAAYPLWQGIERRERAEILADEGLRLLEALLAFEAQKGAPPPSGTHVPEGFNLRTLEPLASSGYLGHADGLLARLRGRRVAAYDAPGLHGGEGFWAILQDARHPGIQVVAASTDAFPLAPNTWIEGVYYLRGDELERVRVAAAPRATR